MKVVTAGPTGAYFHCHFLLLFVTACNIHNDVSVGSFLIRNVE